MKYYSTNNRNNKTSLRNAVIKGLADDKGLYMPEKIPTHSDEFFKNIEKFSYQEIAYKTASLLFDDIPKNELLKIVESAINFDTPLISLDDSKHVLELFHGPTLAFKDVGARFMSRLLEYFYENTDDELYVLVATSGDTGSAVANGFLNVKGINVIILYPKGGVSKIQEQQLTTLGNNITALEIEGTFDDCQKLVKTAFLDKNINKQLTSANSINIARLVPQSFYFFNAYAQLKDKNKKFVVSIPSGNYGNLSAGLIAQKMGLKVSKFIASTNINNIVPEYIKTGNFEAKPSVATISNAMDVGNPSNFYRMTDLFDNDYNKFINNIAGYHFNDEQTKDSIIEIYKKYNYIIDPHGAVAYLGLKKYMENNNNVNGVIFETASPAKFTNTVEPLINKNIEMPERLKSAMNKEKVSTVLANNYNDFKDYLNNNF